MSITASAISYWQVRVISERIFFLGCFLQSKIEFPVLIYETAACMNDPRPEFGLEAFYVMGKLVNFPASVSPFDRWQQYKFPHWCQGKLTHSQMWKWFSGVLSCYKNVLCWDSCGEFCCLSDSRQCNHKDTQEPCGGPQGALTMSYTKNVCRVPSSSGNMLVDIWKVWFTAMCLCIWSLG